MYTPQLQVRPPVVPSSAAQPPIPAPPPAASSAGAFIDTNTVEVLIANLRYVDKPRVARDVIGLIKNSNSIAYKVGTMVHPNGSSETLLQLIGTTPIYYKGACYNIPVTIWIGEQYPHRPPTCYVTPTKDMRIKDGHLHVDHYGLIYLPYLNQWNAQNSNILEMVTMMSSVFSADPPVFKVPANAPPRPSPQPQQPQQQPQQQQQPPYGAQQANPYAQPHPSPAGSVSSPSPSPASVSPPQDPRATRKNQLLATLTSKLRQQLQDDLSLKTLLLDDLLQNQRDLDTHGRAIEERIATLKSESDQLDQANCELENKNQQLTQWLEQYEKRDMVEIDKVCYVKDSWSKQSGNATNIAQCECGSAAHRAQAHTNLFSCFLSSFPVRFRLLDNVALDSALEDTYYLLDRALADDRIDLHTYTKQMRNLSRKQFYARALVAQIQQQQQQQANSAPSQQNANNYMHGYMQQNQPGQMH